MKKARNLFMTIIILSMTFALAACMQEKPGAEDPTKGETFQTDYAQSTPNESELSLPVSYDFKTQYIRTNGYHSDVVYPLAFLIDSKAALEKYYTDNAERYDLSHKDTVYSDTTIGFEDAIQKYDDKWFETHRLILAVLEEGSGSIRHKVVNVSRVADDSVTVEITRYIPECGTDDMAEWHVLIEMNGADLQSADQLQVTFTEDEKLEWLAPEEDYFVEQSFFNVELSEYDAPVDVMIYQPTREDSGELIIHIIKDGEVVQQITSWLPDGVEDGRLISVDAVAFPDYDMDGNTDMILIYTIEGGRVIDILDGYDLKNLSWQSEFEHNLDLANALMQRTEEELNMANVKKFLGYKGKGETFSSWQEAYRFIARLESIQQSRYQYNLIYFDEDEVPELVVDLPGRVSLYTYADGQLYRLMDRWGYGMLGNNGYQYLPRGNRMFNRDSDYAGAIYSDTIIRMNSDHRLEEVVEIFTVNFDDKNGDGYPEEDEIQTLGKVSTSYIGDRVISEEEYASYFAEAEKAEWISGKYGYEELLEKLENQ